MDKANVIQVMVGNKVPSEVIDAVFKGAALLDDNLPEDWSARIDLDDLSIQNSENCVLAKLGKLYHSEGGDIYVVNTFSGTNAYCAMHEFLGLGSTDGHNAGAHGFDASDAAYDEDRYEEMFDDLNVAWHILLKARNSQ